MDGRAGVPVDHLAPLLWRTCLVRINHWWLNPTHVPGIFFVIVHITPSISPTTDFFPVSVFSPFICPTCLLWINPYSASLHLIFPLQFVLTVLEYALIISIAVDLFILFLRIILVLALRVLREPLAFRDFILAPHPKRKNFTYKHMPSCEFMYKQTKLSKNSTYLYCLYILSISF